MATKRRFTGALATPPKLGSPPYGVSRADLERATRSDLVAQYIALWRELHRFYGLTYPDASGLAWALARDYVPAFGITSKRSGAPVRWDLAALAELREAVDQLRGSPRFFNVSDACRELVRKKRFSRLIPKAARDPTEILRRRYYVAGRGQLETVKAEGDKARAEVLNDAARAAFAPAEISALELVHALRRIETGNYPSALRRQAAHSRTTVKAVLELVRNFSL